MKKTTWFHLLILFLCVASFAFIYGCGANPSGGGSSPSGGGRVYYGMNSRGGIVKVTMTNTTFKVEVTDGQDHPISFSGILVTNESGLFSAEVNTTSNPSAISTEALFYAYEITNEVLVMGGGNPGEDGVLIICPAYTTVAPQLGSYEAIMIPWTDWNIDNVAYSTIEVSGSYTFNYYAYDFNGSWITNESISGYSFSGGKLYKGADYTQVFYSASGLFVGTNGKYGGNWNDGGFVGTQYDSSVLTSEIRGVSEYRGVAYDTAPDGTSPKNVKPLYVKSGSGLLQVSEMDPLSGNPVSLLGTLDVQSIDDKGIISGQINQDTDVNPAKLVAAKYLNKYIVCGMSTIEDSSGGPVTFVIFEK